MAIQDGLISYWDLDETSGTTADDQVGVNDGTYVGTPSPSTSIPTPLTHSVRSLEFNGTSDSVDCGNDSSLKPASGMSISAWVFVDVFTNFGGVAVNTEDSGNSESGFYLTTIGTVNTFRFWMAIGSGAGQGLSIDSGSLNTGQWYHIVGTYDGTDQKLYVDGSEVATLSRSGSINYEFMGSNDFHIGQYKDTDEDIFLDGRIDDVAYWDRGLTPGEVTQLFGGVDLGNIAPTGSYNSVTQRI